MSVEPGQVYDRAGVVVLVLRRRAGPPEEWGNISPKSTLWQTANVTWYDVLNLSSETEIDFHAMGRVVAWREDLFDPVRCTRIA